MLYLYKAAIGTDSPTEADAVCLPEFSTSLSVGGLNEYLMAACPDMLDGMMKYEEEIQHIQPFLGEVVAIKSSGRYKMQFHCLTIEVISSEEQFNAVSKCIKTCLELSARLGLKSIVMPAFGTGIIGTLSPEQSAEAILHGISSAKIDGEVPDIKIAVISDEHYDRFAQVLDEHELVNEAELVALAQHKPGQSG